MLGKASIALKGTVSGRVSCFDIGIQLVQGARQALVFAGLRWSSFVSLPLFKVLDDASFSLFSSPMYVGYLSYPIRSNQV